MIEFEESSQIFHLSNHKISYVMELARGKYLLHRYFGQKIRKFHNSNVQQISYRSFNINQEPDDWRFSLTELPQEITSRGYGDFRLPSLTVTQSNFYMLL